MTWKYFPGMAQVANVRIMMQRQAVQPLYIFA